MTDKAIVSTATNVLPQCPTGKPQCDIIDRLSALREEVAVLCEQVHTDTLTGLFNFRHFSQALALEMERTRRTEQATALIMVDLDYFKNVNDTWGHEAGNQALVTVAQVLRQTTRQLDINCRYGGEEFAVILPSVDLIVSIQVAERIRAAVQVTPVAIGGEHIALTASLGVALYDGRRSETQQSFIHRADQYLYQAKQAGRNGVCHETKELDNLHVTVSDEEKDALFDLFESGDK